MRIGDRHGALLKVGLTQCGLAGLLEELKFLPSLKLIQGHF